ncbi:hypothetical protein ACTFIU_003463 [Dictyostelium citrinum]
MTNIFNLEIFDNKNNNNNYNNNNNNNNNNNSFNNNINNYNFYFKDNNKCFQHENQDIIAICTQCINSPVCLECVTSKHFHQGHILEKINKDTVAPIINEFKDIIKPQLNQYLKKSEDFLDQLEIKFNELSIVHKNNINLVYKEFKQLHLVLQIIENDLIKQLETIIDENLQTNAIIKSLVENNNKIIFSSCELIDFDNNNPNPNPNNNNNNNKDQLIQIIKTYYHFKKLLNNINNKNNNGEVNFSPPFNNKIVSIKKDSSEIIKQCLNSILTITSNDKNDSEFNYGNITLGEQSSNDNSKERILNNDRNYIDIKPLQLSQPPPPPPSSPHQILEIGQQLIKPIQPSYKPQSTQIKPPKLEPMNIEKLNNGINNYSSYFQIQNKITNNNMKPIQFDNEKKSMVYQDGFNIPNDIEFITIGEGQHLPDIIPINCKWVLLPHGFNESLQSLPSTVEHLCIYNLKSLPNDGLIPKSIKSIHFYDDLNSLQLKQLNQIKKK